MNFTVWKYVATVLLPVPAVFLGLLLFPAPRGFTRSMVKVANRTLNVQVFERLPLMYFILGTMTISLINVSYETYRIQQQLHSIGSNTGGIIQTADSKMQLLGKKWREERNFWIAILCITLWVILARVIQILKYQFMKEDEYKIAQQQYGLYREASQTSTPAGTPQKTASSSATPQSASQSTKKSK